MSMRYLDIVDQSTIGMIKRFWYYMILFEHSFDLTIY